MRTTYIIDFDSTFTQVEALDELARISLKNHPDRESHKHDEMGWDIHTDRHRNGHTDTYKHIFANYHIETCVRTIIETYLLRQTDVKTGRKA